MSDLFAMRLLRWAVVLVGLASCAQPPPEGSVFLGDSITRNWQDSRISASWSQVLGIVPGAVNAGYPGESAEQIEGEFRKLRLHPRFLHILAGTNNDLRGNPQSAVATVERIAAKVERGGGKVVIGTIPPYDAAKFWQAGYAASYNAMLKSMAARHGYAVADYYAAMIGPDGKQRPDLFLDGIHPNAEGYAIMFAVLAHSVPTF